MIECVWNKNSGSYEVEAFGKIHQFEDRLSGEEYAEECNEWIFSDPINYD